MKNTILASLVTLILAPLAEAQCVGDIAADGRVDGGDLGVQLANWGPVTSTALSQACDLDGNGVVDGADLGTLLANWGYCPMIITDLTPNQGCFLGGTEVTISGEWLGQIASVEIGGVPCSNVTPVSSTMVKATTPAGTLGPASVVVTSPTGTVTASQNFTYMPASVSSISPNVGNTSGGLQITINGAYLALTTDVTIGGIPTSNVTVINSSTVTAVTPPGSLGAADVVITGAKGSITIPGGFQYAIILPSWATLIEARPDSSVVTNPTLRAAIIATGLAWRVRHTVTQIEMLLMPPGTFDMGCIVRSTNYACIAAEQPVHTVTITNPFYLGRFELTQAQWKARTGSNPSYFQNLGLPVETVSWNSARGFLTSAALRLPTEAEWEFACRAGTQTPFYNGSTSDGSVGSIAWYYANSAARTHVGGEKPPNALGLYDMLGNVSEWVQDWYGPYSASPQLDPTGPSAGQAKIRRGGSWANDTIFTRSSGRAGDASPAYTNSDVGFRAARNP